MRKILVTPRALTCDGHPLLSEFGCAGFKVVLSTPGRQPTEEELLQLLPGCVGYLAGVEAISARAMETAKTLRVISRNGAGIDNIDLNAARRLNIKVVSASGANARGVAELTLAHMLALARSLNFIDAAMKRELWERPKGIELKGKTLGIIGCGNIGKRVTEFALAMGMQVLSFDLFQDEKFKLLKNFSYVALDEIYANADFISLHCPSSNDGRPLIGMKELEKMKTGVFIINTARAELVDEKALKEALNSGKVAGAGLDAFKTEPPSEWSLIRNSKVLATSHIGGFTFESIDRATSAAIENLLKELKT